MYICICRYYALRKVFNNPFDKIRTCTIIILIWSVSMVLSIPFFVTTDIDYWDYTNLSVICRNLNHKEGDILLFDKIMENQYIVRSTRLISMIIEFIIPTLIVGFYAGKILIRLFDIYLTSSQRVRSSASVNGCEITKRLIFILFIFIMKNTAFVLVTGRWTQVFYDYTIACPTSVSSGKTWFFLYEIYRITTTLNSFIYFWMSSDFRDQCRMFLFKCISSRCPRQSVKEQTLKIVQVLE